MTGTNIKPARPEAAADWTQSERAAQEQNILPKTAAKQIRRISQCFRPGR
jgi:hypothetical protein